MVHHTEFIDSLLREGKISMKEKNDTEKFTYHDSCSSGSAAEALGLVHLHLLVVGGHQADDVSGTRMRLFSRKQTTES